MPLIIQSNVDRALVDQIFSDNHVVLAKNDAQRRYHIAFPLLNGYSAIERCYAYDDASERLLSLSDCSLRSSTVAILSAVARFFSPDAQPATAQPVVLALDNHINLQLCPRGQYVKLLDKHTPIFDVTHEMMAEEPGRVLQHLFSTMLYSSTHSALSPAFLKQPHGTRTVEHGRTMRHE